MPVSNQTLDNGDFRDFVLEVVCPRHCRDIVWPWFGRAANAQVLSLTE
jgi:hypothetical protein